MDQAERSSLNGEGGVVGYQLEEWNADSGCIRSTMGRRGLVTRSDWPVTTRREQSPLEGDDV